MGGPDSVWLPMLFFDFFHSSRRHPRSNVKKIRATCGAGNNAPARSAGGGGGTTVGRGGGVTDDVITARMRAHKEGRDEALFWVLQGVKNND